jgi:hypothetical protein
VQDPAAIREKFFHSDRQDEGGDIAETVGKRPDLVWEMQVRMLAEEAGPDVSFQSLLEIAHLNRILRSQQSLPSGLQRPLGGSIRVHRETKPTAQQATVRFI